MSLFGGSKSRSSGRAARNEEQPYAVRRDTARRSESSKEYEERVRNILASVSNGTASTFQAVKVLSSHDKELRIVKTSLDDRSARVIEAYLSGHPVEALVLDSVLFTDAGSWSAVCGGIGQCVTLESITITHCGVDDTDAGSLAQAILKARGEVSDLDLSHNKLNDPSYFLNIVQHNQHLQVLDLSDNALNAKVLPALELALQAHFPLMRQVFLKRTGLSKIDNGLTDAVDQRSDRYTETQVVF